MHSRKQPGARNSSSQANLSRELWRQFITKLARLAAVQNAVSDSLLFSDALPLFIKSDEARMESTGVEKQAAVESNARSQSCTGKEPQAFLNGSATFRHDKYRKGILFIAISAVAWSTAGLFVRMLPLDAWTILFWRCSFGAGFVTIHLLAVEKRPSWPTRPEMIIAALLALGILAFIPACQLTTISNVSVIFATTPVFTAFVAWLCLGESPHPATMLAGLAIIVGSCVLVWGTKLGSDLIGNALAVAVPLTTAAVTVFIRRYQGKSPLFSICMANILVSLASFWFAAPLLPSLKEMVCLGLFGLVQVELAFVFFLAGTRWVPASEATLIEALQTPLSPFWVWLAVGELPSLTSLLGGGIIAAATGGYLLTVARRARSEC